MRVRVHHNQLTLPEEARRKLELAEDDELDMELVEQGVLLKTTSSMREAALGQIHQAQAGVRLSAEAEALSPEQREAVVVEEVGAVRRDRRSRKSRG